MKKASLLVALVLFQSPFAFAMAAGSGKTLPVNDYAIGFDYNSIFSKDMKAKGTGRTGSTLESSDQFYGTVTYGLMNNGQFSANLSAKLGAADATLESTRSTSKIETLEYGQGFLWGLGGSLAYRFENQVNLSLNMGFNQSRNPLDGVRYDGSDAVNVGGGRHATVSEFQTALIFSKELKPRQNGLTFVPYAGPSLSLTEINTGDISYTSGTFTSVLSDAGMKHGDIIGLIVGLEVYTFNDLWKFAIEGRFFSEEALTLSIHYKF